LALDADPRLTPEELAVLAVLLLHDTDRDFVVSMTLDYLIHAVGWKKNERTLRDLLHRLHAKGCLDFEVMPGQKGAVWTFRILYDGPRLPPRKKQGSVGKPFSLNQAIRISRRGP